MVVEIDLGDPPAGYSLTSAREGEAAKLQFREFTSTEDGQYFVKRLEGWPSTILQQLPFETNPSQVDHMLAVCRHNGRADVYVNELEIKALVRAARKVEAGQGLTKDDLADLERLEFGVSIPDDAGFLFVFSIGWRKGLFYDFGPVCGPDAKPREYDVATLLARVYGHLLFQERFSISDAEWKSLFEAQWFPFTGLSNGLTDALINHIRSGWDPDEILEDIVAEIKGRTSEMLKSWCSHSALQPHMALLQHAVERFQAGDMMSCTALLFPRIEGIMRTHHQKQAARTGYSQRILIQSAVSSKVDNDLSLLLPHRFASYLQDVYFSHFKPDAQDIDVSRNSVGHGVAASENFNQKSAVIGILTVHQLFYFLETSRTP